MCFYFYFSLLHLKLIFCPLPKGENQLAQLESEGLTRWLSLPPGSVPHASCGPCWHTAVPGGASSHGDADKCFYKTSRPGFYTELQQSSRETWVNTGKRVPLCGGKRQYFSLTPRSSMLKGTPGYIRNVMPGHKGRLCFVAEA